MKDSEMVKVLYDAAEKSFTSLFKEHGDEHFYYCTLVMADAATPCISAQSEESLKAYLEENDVDTEDPKELLIYRWSWADSVYCGYGYDEYFGEVVKLFESSFQELPDDDESFERKYNEWFDAMETVMKMLDEKGIFGKGSDRDRVFVYAEESPPDDEFLEEEYRERAKRMNPSAAYKKWLDDQETWDK